jgi:hypothetical protein
LNLQFRARGRASQPVTPVAGTRQSEQTCSSNTHKGDVSVAELSPAEALAEAHPTIAGRLVEQLQDLVVLLDTSDELTFVAETQPRLVLDALIVSATGLADRADELALKWTPRS